MEKGVRRKLARTMRSAPTSTEVLLWKALRGRRLGGIKFRRQVPIGPYVVDFLCVAQKLIVEADGPFHDQQRDAVRDAWLRAKGYEVLRFENRLIHNRPDLVMEQILEVHHRRPASPPTWFGVEEGGADPSSVGFADTFSRREKEPARPHDDRWRANPPIAP